MPASTISCKLGRRDLVVGFEDHFAALFVDDVGKRIRAFKLRGSISTSPMFALRRCFERSGVTFLPLRTIGSATSLDVEIDLHADQVAGSALGHLHHQAAIFNTDFVGDVKRSQHVFVGESGVLYALFERRIVAAPS